MEAAPLAPPVSDRGPIIKSDKVLTSVGRLSLAFGFCGTVPLLVGIIVNVFTRVPNEAFLPACVLQAISAPLATVLGLLSTRRVTGRAGLFLGVAGIVFLLFVRIYIGQHWEG